MRKTLLLLDDDAHSLNDWSQLLQAANYRVLPTTSIAGAEEIMQWEPVHLAILDVRATDNKNPEDKSGIILAQKAEYRSIPKIIFTAYPDWEYTREALASNQEGVSPALDFVFKTEGAKRLIQGIESAFSQLINSNLDLEIKWATSGSFSQVALTVLPQLSSEQCERRARQITSLFYRAFHEYTAVTLAIIPIPQVEHVLLTAAPERNAIKEPQQMVMMTTPENAALEEQARSVFGKLVQEWSLDRTLIESVRLSLATYDAKGFESDSAQFFGDFARLSTTKNICDAITDWYVKSCRTLYSQPCTPSEDKSLNEILREKLLSTLSESQYLYHLREAMKYVNLDANLTVALRDSDQQLVLDLGDRQVCCWNPSSYLFRDKGLAERPVLTYLCLPEIGGFDLLVDIQNHVWLMNLSTIEEAPVCSDFVSLESHLRFDWARLEDLGLKELYICEEHLSAPMTLDELVAFGKSTHKEMLKVLEVVNHVRQLASVRTGTAILEYQLIALFQATAVLVSDRPPRTKAHALLASIALSRGLSAILRCSPMVGEPDRERS